MSTYILRRFLQTIVVVALLSFVAYGLMGLMPGDPLDIACAANPHCTSENLAMMKKNLGLDRPLVVRYAEWAGNFIKGDLGYSRTYRMPVGDILWPRLLNSMLLWAVAMVVSFVIAIPLGIYSSLKPGRWADNFLSLISFAGISTPGFWLGYMLMLFFCVKWGILPAGGVESIEFKLTGIEWFLDRMKYLILPVTVLSLHTVAEWSRYTRSAMLDILNSDFLRTARAKGLPGRRVIFVHALRNAMIPIITIVALNLSGLLSGALITETVFSYQGTGKLLYDAISQNDYNVAMCSFVMSFVAILASSLLADILYAVCDPRISLD